MKLVLIFSLLVAFFTFSLAYGVEHGSCDQHRYSLGIDICQAKFFSKLGRSKDPRSECPSLYNETIQCVKTSVFTECYKALGDEKLKLATKRGLEQFGNLTLYCEYGGIASIYPVLIEAKDVECDRPVNASQVLECENPFYDVFRSNPGSEELCSLSVKTGECQVFFLSLCHKAINTMSIPNTAHMTNVHCPAVQDQLVPKDNNRSSNKEASEVHHPTSWDVITPVIVIAVLMLLALIVGFCHYSKQERRKNKQQEKENKKKISEKVQQRRKNGEDAEPRLKEGEEMLPLSGVITNEKEDISQA